MLRGTVTATRLLLCANGSANVEQDIKPSNSATRVAGHVYEMEVLDLPARIVSGSFSVHNTDSQEDKSPLVAAYELHLPFDSADDALRSMVGRVYVKVTLTSHSPLASSAQLAVAGTLVYADSEQLVLRSEPESNTDIELDGCYHHGGIVYVKRSNVRSMELYARGVCKKEIKPDATNSVPTRINALAGHSLTGVSRLVASFHEGLYLKRLPDAPLPAFVPEPRDKLITLCYAVENIASAVQHTLVVQRIASGKLGAVVLQHYATLTVTNQSGAAPLKRVSFAYAERLSDRNQSGMQVVAAAAGAPRYALKAKTAAARREYSEESTGYESATPAAAPLAAPVIVNDKQESGSTSYEYRLDDAAFRFKLQPNTPVYFTMYDRVAQNASMTYVARVSADIDQQQQYIQCQACLEWDVPEFVYSGQARVMLDQQRQQSVDAKALPLSSFHRFRTAESNDAGMATTYWLDAWKHDTRMWLDLTPSDEVTVHRAVHSRSVQTNGEHIWIRLVCMNRSATHAALLKIEEPQIWNATLQGNSAVRYDYTDTKPLRRVQDAVKAAELLVLDAPPPTPTWKRQSTGVPLTPACERGTQTPRAGFSELVVDVPAASGPKAIGTTVLFYKVISQQVQPRQQPYVRLGI